MARVKAFLAFLFMAAITGFMGWWLGPDLIADFQNRSTKLEPARELRLTEAKCRSKLFILSFCGITANGPGLAGGKREFSYFIMGVNTDDGVSLMRASGNGPAAGRHLTTTIGMDYLSNRIISFVALLGILAALCIGGVIAMVRGSRAD